MKIRLPFLLVLLLMVGLPGPAQEQPFCFVMLTDTQFGMYAADRSFEQETANFEFAVATVNRLKPGFVIILGDLVNKAGDALQIGEYQRIARKITPSIPVYHVAGNHDVGNVPTADSLAKYRKIFGPDYYSFQAGPVHGIVLDSTLIHRPEGAMDAYKQQDAWLRKELEAAKSSGSKQLVVFQHHPYFLKDAQEADQYENIPLARRGALLDLFHSYGIHHVFAGHTHKNVVVQDGELEMIASAPVGKPLGKDGSGIRVATISDTGVVHRYYDFGMLPDKLPASKK